MPASRIAPGRLRRRFPFLELQSECPLALDVPATIASSPAIGSAGRKVQATQCFTPGCRAEWLGAPARSCFGRFPRGSAAPCFPVTSNSKNHRPSTQLSIQMINRPAATPSRSGSRLALVIEPSTFAGPPFPDGRESIRAYPTFPLDEEIHLAGFQKYWRRAMPARISAAGFSCPGRGLASTRFGSWRDGY
jgi:hypothetical protein